MRTQHLPLLTIFALAIGLHAASATAQQVFRDDFEGPNATWSVVSSDAAYRLQSQQRVRGGARSGESYEQLQLLANNGSFIYLGHSLRPARIIGELRPSLWVRSERPGMQIHVRAVLPRTLDPRTNKPVTTYLPGTRYEQPGQWQQLRVEQLPELLTRHARVLRTQVGPQVDPREAYIDQILVNVYGGPGPTTVGLDALEVAGVFDPIGVDALEAASGPAPITGAVVPAAFTSGAAPQVQLQGAALLVNGRTLFPRIIYHRGEPLAALQQLGFNVVQLNAPATDEILGEARRLGLWLIAPPPAAPQAITPTHDPIIAWSLGAGLSRQDLDRVRNAARELRSRDPRSGRPLIADCQSDLRSFSRIADVLVVGGSPLGTSLELADYAQWLAERGQFARPGTPLWSRIQTDFDPQLQNQWRLLAGAPVNAVVDAEQVRFLIYTSLAAGARGLVFDSHAPLTGADVAALQRRLILENLNLDLRLIEPWAASGGTRTSAVSSDNRVTGAMLQTDRARLLLPLSAYPSDQFTPHRSPTAPIAFTIPGVPESNNAYEVTPASLPPLRHQRVTGGIRVTQERSDSCSMMVMTSDPRIISGLTREVAQIRRRAAELKREQAMQQMTQVDEVHRRLPAGTTHAAQYQQWLDEARANLAQCQVLWGASDFTGTYREARRTLGALGRIERARWMEAVQTWPSKMTSPFAVTFDTLPQHAEFAGRLAACRLAASRAPAGDFESLDEMLQVGWKHVQHPTPGVESSVELSLLEPHQGRASLRLKAWASDAQNPQTAVETPPVWVTTPPVSFETGQWVRIAAWVRVPQPVKGSVDGLMIVDSYGGPALAERVKETLNWREYVFYRAAPESGPLVVTFALTGLGEAWLDDVRIEPVERPAPGQAAQRFVPRR